MGDFIAYIAKEWNVIWQAPVTFVAAILVTAGLIWAAMEWRYRGVVDGLKERIGLRDDQIAQLKDKVGTSSPDEIKARIDQLEAQVGGLVPRRLSPDQRQRITAALTGSAGSVEVSQDMAALDARALAADLMAAIQAAGWGVLNSMIMGPGNPPASGFGVTIPDPVHPTPRQAALIAGLRDAGIVFDVRQGQLRNVPPIPGGPAQPPLDAAVLVTIRVH